MKKLSIKIVSLSSIVLSIVTSNSAVFGQIIHDETLPNNTIVAPNGHTIRIDGGTRNGGNLFHSFQEFSLDANTRAFFNNATDIQNILTRVTGGKISNIDGLIEANGSANLFLINPNGIVFGPNARLNIGGSFIGSTANSIRFENGAEFRAVEPNAPPLLTINVPIGLQLGQNPGEIRVVGNGHNLTVREPLLSPINRENNNFPALGGGGLQLLPGNTFALVGGDITFDGGVASASNGRLEIGSVRRGNVSLSPTATGWELGYEGAEGFRDVKLNGRSLADTSGIGGGTIQIRARNLELADGSLILIQSLGREPSGDINIQTEESVEVRGTNETGTLQSRLTTETVGGFAGGDIRIETGELTVADGGAIGTRSFGKGDGGNINIRAERIQLLRFSPLNPTIFSNITASTLALGRAGNVTVTTGQLRAVDGGTLASATFGAGNTGETRVSARESIEVIGVVPRLFTPSVIGASSLGSGNAGNLTIDTNKLSVRDGGRIDAPSLATGDGGNVTVNARESIEIDGTVADSINPSLISAFAFVQDPEFQELFGLPAVPSGNSGSVTINTPVLRVTNGGLLGVRNDGPADAGTVVVNADSILVGSGGAITAFTNSGEGGNIEIDARQVIVDNGLIDASVLGDGTGGDITIRAEELVEVVGSGFPVLQENTALLITREGVSILDVEMGIVSGTNGGGDAGDIQIETGRLIVRDGGLIGAPTLGRAGAGNIILNVSELLVDSSLVATATSGEGAGGSIVVDADKLTATNGGLLSATTFGSGEAGDLTVRVSETVELRGSAVGVTEQFSGLAASSQPETTGAAGSINLTAGELRIGDRAEISVSSDGLGDAGNLTINARSFTLDSGRAIATSPMGSGGNINLGVSGRLLLRNSSEISTRAGTEGSGGGDGGNITLGASTIAALGNSRINANAFEGAGGNIRINTRGVFLGSGSGITASSQLGVDGTVEIEGLDGNPSKGLANLPVGVADLTALIASGCEEYAGSEYIIIGRGGLPPTPSEAIALSEVWQDWREEVRGFRGQRSEVFEVRGQGSEVGDDKSSSQLIEATGWVRRPDGTIELVANMEEPGNSWYNLPNCHNN